MLVLALNSGHDGALAAVKDGELMFSLEAEKNSFRRYSAITATTSSTPSSVSARWPDAVAFTGWHGSRLAGTTRHRLPGRRSRGAAPHELPRTQDDASSPPVTSDRTSCPPSRWLRRDGAPVRAALVWEGLLGKLYLVEGHGKVVRRIHVHDGPGTRWSLLFCLADPTFPGRRRISRAGSPMPGS